MSKPAAHQSADPLRAHLLELLGPGAAHADFDNAIAGLPPALRGAKPPRMPTMPHTPWRLLEHMRLAQADILAFTRDARHESPAWPAGYWPASDAPPDDRAWDRSAESYRADRQAFIAIVEDARTDLLAPLPHATASQKQTVTREALLLADHTAYHLGQLILLRRALGAWAD